MRNLERMKIPGAHAVTSGAPSTRIAVLDTGLDPSAPQLAGAIVPGWDLVLDGGTMTDADGHGTVLAHAVAGRPRTAGTVASPCQRCSVMPFRIIDTPGAADFATVDARLAEGLRMARDRGAAVALIGLVVDRFPPATAAAIEEVTRDGVVVVAPAGNRRHAFAQWPARLPQVISVAASQGTEDALGTGSNGPLGVQLWAPADHEYLGAPGGTTREGTGSSLAAAYVAGVVGLVKTVQPALSPGAIRSLLMATTVPLAPGRLSSRDPGGRVDAQAALRRVLPGPSASGRIADLRVSFAELLPRRPKPGQQGRVRLRLENAGTLPMTLDDASLRLWRGGAAEVFEAGTGTLAPGEWRWLELPYVARATAGPDPLVVEVGDQPGHSLAVPNSSTVPGNDALPVLNLSVEPPAEDDRIIPAQAAAERATEIEVVRADVRDVELSSLEQAPGTERDPDRFVLLATFVNSGNVTLTAGVQAQLETIPLARLPDVPWQPGERRTLRLVVEKSAFPAEPDWRIRLSSTVDDDEPANDTLTVRVGSGVLEHFRPAYGDFYGGFFDGSDVIFDAPYRIDVNSPYVPILTFIPQWQEPSVMITGYTVYAREARPLPAGSTRGDFEWAWRAISSTPVFAARRSEKKRLNTTTERIVGMPRSSSFMDAGTRSPGWTPEIVTEDGGLSIVREDGGISRPVFFGPTLITDNEYGAWHRVLRVPWREATTDFQARRAGGTMYFLTMLSLWVPRLNWGADREQYWAVLKVTKDKLPEVTGPFAGRYYDAHFHTIAEGATGGGLRLGGFRPAQSWGAPLVMVAEAAFAHGFTGSPALSNQRDLVITTDHNQFYSQPGASIPRDWSPGSGPTAGMTGPMEFATMRRLFGNAAGEEVSIVGDTIPGRHLLVYGSPHFEGPWHGGMLLPNPNTTASVLARMKTSPALPIGAGAFPAHPFSVVPAAKSPEWQSSNVEELLGLWPFTGNDSFTNAHVPLGRGYQVWNMKADAIYPAVNLEVDGGQPRLDQERMHRADAWAFLGDPRWQTVRWLLQFRHDQERWMQFIRAGLNHEEGADAGVRFIRKAYGLGGTDAHGDFNYTTDLSTTIASNSAGHFGFYALRPGSGEEDPAWTRNAWGRVRTVALAPTRDPTEALTAMMQGNAIITDGPLIKIAIDGDARLRLDRTTNKLEYDHLSRAAPFQVAFDEDGRMGGTGPAGGGGTALLLFPERAGARPAPWIRYQSRSPSQMAESGGSLAEISLWNLPSPRSAWNQLPLCQIDTQGWNDDEAYHKELFPGWAPSGPENGAVLARASTARITRTSASTTICQTWFTNPDGGVVNGGQLSIGLSNPAWWAAGTYRIEVSAECRGPNTGALVRDVKATVTLPLSMAAPRLVFLEALGSNGRPTPGGARLPATTITLQAVDGVAGRRWVFEWRSVALPTERNSLDLPSTQFNSGSLLITVEDPSDHFGNRLNAVAMTRHLAACADGTVCCELNPGELDRPCFGASRHGACGACGRGCAANETCDFVNPQYVCRAPTGSFSCTHCAGTCCYRGQCLPPPAHLEQDYSCGACGNACAPGAQCCDRACVARNLPTHCGRCGNTCGADEQCCNLSCRNVKTDRNNCGACGRVCGESEMCCAGNCVRKDSPLHCGDCATRCRTDERCCTFGINTGYSCQNINDDRNCGHCGLVCPAGTSCSDQACH